MIEEAEKEGLLTKDKIILEATSGNTGIGLAMVGCLKGYKVLLVMSSGVSVERQKMIKAFGAEIILTDANLGTDGAILKTKELIRECPDKYFNLDQYSNDDNSRAHYHHTAEEIWNQTKGQVTHVICSIGTTGTIMGIGEKLREKNPNIKIIGAEPIPGHKIQGLKNLEVELVPSIYNPDLVDNSFIIENEEAYEMARKIVLEEGIFVGMSCGAAMVAALKTIEEIDSGVVVVIFPDRGEKYLSTVLFDN